ncbi:MAG: hypothetical protein D6798_15030 [Deltaproteobacteria bacterium]|nr:MAG: hypothetical protein D6798_15030 [Deltaproteobacteria bacterium]
MLTLATLLLVAPAHAGEDDARTCIQAKVHQARAEGWSVRTRTTSTLQAGALDVYAMTLQAGIQYRFIACGDTSVADVGLYVYDGEGRVVARDLSVDREPHTDYTPPATGRYYVVVQAVSMVGGAATGAISTAVTYK